ncbi:MAG: hypothetical protein ACYC6I_11880, partial [Bacillota bacterium]
MPYEGLDVIDFHVHLPIWGRRPRGGVAPADRPKTRDLNQEYSLERRAIWRKEWGFPDPEDANGATEEELVARWAAEVDKYGLKKVVLVT